jgi:hypothetical protein
MDLIGAALMMSLIVSYILALQYGGQTHPWKSSQVIGLLVGFVAIVAVFISWEIFQKERAMIVKRLVRPTSDHIQLNDLLTTAMLTDPEALRLGRFCIHVLLRRVILLPALLSADLLPEHPQRQPNRLWCQNARLDHPSYRCRHRARLCTVQDRHSASVLARGRRTGDRWRWTALYHGRQHFNRQVDRLPDPARLREWLDFPGCYRQCANLRSARRSVAGHCYCQL